MSFEESRLNGKVFCMLPWIHMHVLPNSVALPCSLWPYDNPAGNVANSTLGEIWNSDLYKELRLKMLSGEFKPECSNCYKMENAGAASLRQWTNDKFKHHYEQAVKTTRPDGSLSEYNMVSFDIRFSNICNFKCRGCCPELSSSWFEDFDKLHNNNSVSPKQIRISDSSRLWSELLGFIDTVEEVYFAGGEPLLMEEHFRVLDELIKRKKFDVALGYNTNISITHFKDKSICEYWSLFPKVNVGISIDDIGARGEYFRHGMDWKRTLKNIKYIRAHCSHVTFYVNCTLNVMNVLYLPEIHAELIREGIIQPEEFYASFLFVPEELSVWIIPREMKKVVVLRIEKYMSEYLNLGWKPETITYVNSIFDSVLNFVAQEDKSDLISLFRDRTRKLDNIRGESYEKTFPELATYIPLKE
jgi:MoaA/NifB/PqqE/SkfB family radical SAM enzyme